MTTASMPASGTFLLAEEGVLLPGFDRGALPAVGAGDVEVLDVVKTGMKNRVNLVALSCR